MRVSIAVTVLSEQETVGALLDSLLVQTKKPDEIIIVDGGSTDKTVEIIRHFQKKDKRIKLLAQRCSRARGRNLGVEMAKNEIIAMTDAGCVADKNWLKTITEPFQQREIGVVAGFYRMRTHNSFQKAASIFLGILPDRFDQGFFPSTRSIAFRKSVWETVGGFDERLADTAEDTLFNDKILKSGVKISRVKEAVVEWGMPLTLKEFFEKVFKYAKGDAKSKIWIFPGKGFASHNIKALSVVLRYLAGLWVIILSLNRPVVLVLLVMLVLLYFFRSFRKVFDGCNDVLAGLWGIILQLVSDFAVISGFLSGILN